MAKMVSKGKLNRIRAAFTIVPIRILILEEVFATGDGNKSIDKISLITIIRKVNVLRFVNGMKLKKKTLNPVLL